MPSMRKSPVRYSPRGVTKQAIALRLLAPERLRHDAHVRRNDCSSAAFARQMYLRGLESYERATAVSPSAGCMNTVSGVNRA
jgi:hypothetical protein